MSTWHLECSACDHTQPGDTLASVCPDCGQPFLVRYDMPWPSRDAIGARWDMWRYAAMLPLHDDETPVSLGEGATPLHELPRLAQEIGVARLWVKDEGLNPTASFKARGMSAAVTRAAVLGVPGFVVPTAGNAGAALAAYGAAAGIPVRVYAPATTPAPILATISALGADLQLVDGHIGDAGKQSRAFAAEHGWFDVSTLREPYRIEGKKTMGYEIAEQLGWRLPDVILYPAGGGVGLIGIYKAIQEMQALGWTGPDLPRLVAVQADGCAPIVRAFESGATESEPFPNAHTVAFGITVPKALGDFLVLDAVRSTGGTAISVSDEELLAEQHAMAVAEGAFICPEGAACLAAARQLREADWLADNDSVVVLNTGMGLKYPQMVSVDVSTLSIDSAIPAESAPGRQGR
ncbi:MAG TPA: threonine synthase [Gemmatimonadaceae bacterium]